MLMGRKVGHDFEGAMVPEELFEDGIPEIDRIGDEFLRDVVFNGAPQVTHQFSQSVFIDIDHHQLDDVEFQDGFDVGGADGSGAADHQYFFAIDSLVKFSIVFQKVIFYQALRAFGDVCADKVIYIEISLQKVRLKECLQKFFLNCIPHIHDVYLLKKV
jgi:hypothetical protein